MSKYRIEVNRDECTGEESCVEEAPNTFAIDDDGLIRVVDPEGDSDEEILAAAQACPTNAIVLYDAETGEQVWP